MVLVVACSEELPRANGVTSISVLCQPMRNGRPTRAGVWDDVPTPDYPERICVVPSTGASYIIQKGGDTDNAGYVAYHMAEDGPTDLQMEGKTFRAYAPGHWTDVPAISAYDYLSGNGTFDWNKGHLFLELKHATALLRFRFAVDAEYDKSRQVMLKAFELNGTDIAVKGGNALLGTTMSCQAVCYVNPSLIKKGDALSLQCTYDIYDKDATSAEHLNRKDVKANNSIVLGAAGSSISELKVAYYYDFDITINPTYMNVMSEHDNKHMTIQ